MFISNTIPYLVFFTSILFIFLVAKEQFSSVNCYVSINLLAVYSFFLFSIVFIGCRGFVGADWLNYKPYFDDAPSLFSSWTDIYSFVTESYFEKGYAIFTIIVKSITRDFLGFQFICFIIDIFILHFFFLKYCPKYYFLCWTFFWIFQGFIFEIITLRNTKSILLFLLSIKYIEKKSFVKYLLINIAGCLFHVSSILYFPFYFICKCKRRKILEITLFIIGNIVFLLQIPWLKNILVNFVGVFPGKLGSLFSIYFASEHYSSARGITIGYLERLFSFVLLMKFSDTLIKDNEHNKIFWYAFLLFSYIYLFCSEMNIILERVPNLFIFSYWLLYPQIYSKLKKEWKYIFIIIVLFYGILRNISLLNQKWAYYDNLLFNPADEVTRERYFTY